MARVNEHYRAAGVESMHPIPQFRAGNGVLEDLIGNSLPPSGSDVIREEIEFPRGRRETVASQENEHDLGSTV